MRRTSWITPTGQRLIRNNLRRRNGDLVGLGGVSSLQRDTMPFVELRHRVGKINNVLMAVDVGHNGKGVEERGKWRRDDGSVLTEDDRDSTVKLSTLIKNIRSSIKSPISNRIFPNPYLSIKPSTLMLPCDLSFILISMISLTIVSHPPTDDHVSSHTPSSLLLLLLLWRTCRYFLIVCLFNLACMST